MDSTVVEARKRGYTETLFGRRRPIPELLNGNWRIRQAGERQAMNAGIQGLAADIFKVALVRVDQALEERGVASRLVLQVHDEVLVEVPDDERESRRPARRRPHAQRRRPRRPARGQRRLGHHLGRCQVLTGITSQASSGVTDGRESSEEVAGPLVRADRRAPRRGVPALLVHQGDGPGGRPRGRRARPAPGRPCARRRVRTRTPRPRAGPAGVRRPRHRHLGRVRRAGPPRRARRCDVRAPRRPGDGRSTPSSTPSSASARERSG